MESPVFRAAAFLTLTLLALNGAALAQASAPPNPGAAAPRPRSLYPDRAQRMEVNGKTVMDCQVTAEGRLTDCVVLSETPEGYGFAEATLELSKVWKMKPTLDPDGKPIPGGRLTIPINWNVPR